MRYLRIAVGIVLLASSLLPHDVGVAAPPRPPDQLQSVAGQVNVVTVNAKQNRVLGLARFLALFELPKALRFRPEAFNGGVDGSVTAPDVIIVQEVRPSNLEIFVRLLRQRFPYKYQVLEPLDAAASFVVNTDTVAVQGEVTTWADVCTTADTPTDKRPDRDYPIVHLTEIATNAPFVVAGMHMAKRYDTTGQSNCVPRNIETLRAELADETAPVIIGGDFNRRAAVDPFECDVEERSTPNSWHQLLVTPPEGETVYVDAVRHWHRNHRVSMEHEWTHEQRQSRVLCDQTTHFKRSRIDYLFTNAVVAEAHADHPGWAGREPGTPNPPNRRYSDHRYVWGRFVVSGPPRPLQPSAVAGRAGRIDLTWQPVEGAAGYVVYRAHRGRAYSILGTVGADVLAFADVFTEHARSYRYAVAAVGADGGIGLESRPAFGVADKKGPHAVRVTPARNAAGVDPAVTITVRYDERVASDSVAAGTIRVTQGRRTVPGALVVVGPRLLTFDPFGRLDKGKTYRVSVDSVRDKLGNAGPRVTWDFTTVEPPPPPPKKRRS
ncbi:MAG TPA: Ig-like domain-containing protein [Actinomycetota bacterium]|nr:Ig-like domain-containing protein [Actinomycetota bacterium]